jgi:uncharacterized membrane protein (UPF0127 family)
MNIKKRRFKMKRIDRLSVVLSVFVVMFFVIIGILFYFKADEIVIFMFSIFALLILVIYLFGELVVIDIKEMLEAQKQYELRCRKKLQKLKEERQGWAGFRRLFGGENYE